MASLFRRSDSTCWWIKYRDDTGRLVRESTGYRVGPETRQARILVLQRTLSERQRGNTRHVATQRWEAWVPSYLDVHVTNPNTARASKRAWRVISEFLRLRGAGIPSLVTRETCSEFVVWRTNPGPGSGRRAVNVNSALQELSLLRALLSEAVRRGYCHANPARELRIPRRPSKEKPELTDAQIAFIRSETERDPHRDFLRASFEVAIHQGCRLMETRVRLADIDTERMTIRFRHTKGNPAGRVSPLHPGLLPLIQELRARGAVETWSGTNQASSLWKHFLRRIGLGGLCFHCTRVTVVTRLARAGVPEPKARQFVGHASATVHRIYQRFLLEDQQACVAALTVAPAPPLR